MLKSRQDIDAFIKVLQESYWSSMWPEFSKPLAQCRESLDKMDRHSPRIKETIDILDDSSSPAFIKEAAFRNAFKDVQSYVKACEHFIKALDEMINCVTPRFVAVAETASEQDRQKIREDFKRGFDTAKPFFNNAMDYLRSTLSGAGSPVVPDADAPDSIKDYAKKVSAALRAAAQWVGDQRASGVHRGDLLRQAYTLETNPPELGNYAILVELMQIYRSSLEEHVNKFSHYPRPPKPPEYYI